MRVRRERRLEEYRRSQADAIDPLAPPISPPATTEDTDPEQEANT